MKKLLFLLTIFLSCNKYMKELVYKNKIGDEYWKYIIEDKDEELKKYLEENKNIDINKEQHNGEVALTLAAKYNSRKIINLLLSNDLTENNLIKEKIDINGKNSNGQTPLIASILNRSKCFERNLIIKKLLNNGAKVDARYGTGCNTLMLAIIEGDSSIVEEILNKSIDINEKNLLGETALILAIKSDNLNINEREKIIKLLVNNESVNFEIQDKEGKNALMYLIIKDNYESLFLLIAAKEKKDLGINLQDEGGKTPLMYCIEKRNYKFVHFLLNKKCLNLNIKDLRGKCAAIYLLENFDNGIFNLFKNTKNYELEGFNIHLICKFILEIVPNLEKGNIEEVIDFFKNFENGNKYLIQSLIKFLFDLTFKGKLEMLNNLLSLFNYLIKKSDNTFLKKFISIQTSNLVFQAFEDKNESWVTSFFESWKGLDERYNIFNLYNLDKEGRTILILSSISNFNEVIKTILSELESIKPLKAIKYIETVDKSSKNALHYIKRGYQKKELENLIKDICDKLSLKSKIKYKIFKEETNVDGQIAYLKENDIELEKFLVKLIKEGDEKSSLKILKSKAKLNLNFSFGKKEKKVIHYAAIYCRKAIFDEILKIDFKQVNVEDKDKNTPLIHLVKSDFGKREERLEILDILLKNDKLKSSLDINFSNIKGKNAYLISCIKGDYEIFKKLIEVNGINLDIDCKNGKKLIQNVLDSILNTEVKYDIFDKSSYMDIIKLMLKKQIELGKDILSYVLKEKDYISKNLYKILKNNKFNFNHHFKKYKEELTSEDLHDHIKKGDINFIEDFISSFNSTNHLFNLFSEENKTALHYSIPFPKLLEKVLRVEKINLNANKNGYTPLVEAILLNNLESLEILLNFRDPTREENEGRIDINITTKDKNTPLMLALYKKNIKAAKIILKRKDHKLYLKNKEGKTAFDIAVLQDMREIAKKILKRERKNLVASPLAFSDLRGSQKIIITESIEEEEKNGGYPTYYESFITAAKRNYLELIELSLNKKLIDISYRDEYISFLRDLAINKENISLLEILMKEVNMDINFIFKSAIEKDKSEILSWSLEKNINVNFKYKAEKTSLMYASQYGNLELVKELIYKGANVNSKDKHGTTPLMYATYNNNLDIVENLIKSRADVNTKEENGHTPLMLASIKGNIEIMNLLINKGATVGEKDFYRMTALMYSSFQGHESAVDLLLKKGADVNEKEEEGYTSLMLASINGNKNLVKMLVENKANIEDTNNYRETALMCAVYNGHIDILKFLVLEKGAKVDLVDIKGFNPLMIAVQTNNKEIVEFLVKKRVNINFKNTNDFNTPLMLATKNGNKGIVELLLREGAKVNEKNSGGFNALMIASQKDFRNLGVSEKKEHIEIIENLIFYGIDINAVNNGNWTALIIACEKGNIEIAKLLIEKGAKIQIRNKNNETALMAASNNGHRDIENLIIRMSSNTGNK